MSFSFPDDLKTTFPPIEFTAEVETMWWRRIRRAFDVADVLRDEAAREFIIRRLSVADLRDRIDQKPGSELVAEAVLDAIQIIASAGLLDAHILDVEKEDTSAKGAICAVGCMLREWGKPTESALAPIAVSAIETVTAWVNSHRFPTDAI